MSFARNIITLHVKRSPLLRLRETNRPFPSKKKNNEAPSTRIRIFLNPQLFLSGLKNFHVHTYPYSNRICPSTRIRHVSGFTLIHSSTQDSYGNIGNRSRASSMCRKAREISSCSALREPGLPSWLHYSREWISGFRGPYDSGFIAYSKC